MILYRIITVLVNLFCAFIAVVTMFGLAIAFFNPTLLLQCFIMGATVLYAWHANRFF